MFAQTLFPSDDVTAAEAEALAEAKRALEDAKAALAGTDEGTGEPHGN